MQLKMTGSSNYTNGPASKLHRNVQAEISLSKRVPFDVHATELGSHDGVRIIVFAGSLWGNGGIYSRKGMF